jgi:hypothetical protein
MFSWDSLQIFLRPLVTIAMGPLITGMSKHSLNFYTNILYFNFFSATFYITFLSDRIATFIDKQILYLAFNCYVWPIGQNLSVPLDPIVLLYLHVTCRL